jgi:hypothetical protein
MPPHDPDVPNAVRRWNSRSHAAPKHERVREAAIRMLAKVSEREGTLRDWEKRFPGTIPNGHVIYVECDAADVKMVCDILAIPPASGEPFR